MGAPAYSLPDETFCLLTGATGALGQEVLFTLLAERPEVKLLVIARGGKGGNAEKRIRAIMRKRLNGVAQEDALKRAVILDGDVTEPHLGLSPELWLETAARTSHIIHCAAAVRFDQPLEEARQINLEGTRNVLELARAARRAGLEARFDYISTAYVAGKRKGVVYENELEHNKGFHNTYEMSKYETEIMMRVAKNELPVTVMRPSIIIGNSRTGETGNFKAFYWPIRVYAMNQMRVLPAINSSLVDLVPVDYVARAITHLSSLPEAIGQTYHLTAGRENLITVGEIARAAINFFGVKPPLMLHPGFLKLAESRLSHLFLNTHTLKTLKLGEPYYPYLALKLQFDDSKTQQVLGKAGITAPPVRQFFDTLFQYCVETDWGHKQPGTLTTIIKGSEPKPIYV